MKLMIREIRHAKGVSQEDLAHAAGVRVATISEIENGKGNPRITTLQAIAGGLGVPVIDLFRAEDDNPRETALLEGFRRLSAEDQAAFLRLVSRTH